jgi:hypothetical protein
MIWKSIRLELAGTADYPRGSPSRVYLLRLPLGANGEIDRQAVRQHPRLATVRRFWPSEPDRTGYLTAAGSGFEITYDMSLPEEGRGRLESEILRLGDSVALIEADGTRIPLRVAALEQFA